MLAPLEIIENISRLSDAYDKYTDAQLAGANFEISFMELQFKFRDAGAVVKKMVDKRTEHHRELDYQRDRLSRLEVEDKEIGREVVPYEDPLVYIESKYNFFQDASTCPLENIGNVENPEACIKAMSEFVSDLYDNIHRFKNLPIGPLFTNCVIKKKKWAPLIEYVLRPHLFTFLVDNIVDGLVFEELIEQNFPGYKPGDITKEGIVCPKFEVFSFFNAYEPSSRITSITGLDVENMAEGVSFITDDWSKFLSQAMNLEKILLMENENAAFLVMSHIRNTPWHCELAYTLDGFKVHPFPCFRTTKVEFFPYTMYIQCGLNFKLCDLRYMTKLLERRIQVLNADINEKRKVQLNVAKEMDELRPKIQAEKEKERHYRKVIKALKAAEVKSISSISSISSDDNNNIVQ